MTAEWELRKFVVPEFVFGSGARFLAGRYARNLGARKVLLVTDAGVWRTGWASQVADNLAEQGLPYEIYAEVTANPRSEQVMSGAECYQQTGCNVIVAVGGGSPMDCAKGIGIVSANGGSILDYAGVDEVQRPGPPLICIPTTAGSGADVSQFAVISDDKRQVKQVIVSKTAVPDAALIDPDTTVTMDRYLTACTGLDVLVHAVEAYVSNAHSPVTDTHALAAIRLLSTSLNPAVREPNNLQARGQMLLACLHAGIAFSNASLGAVHAMAHALGARLGLPHGEANALLLARVISYNFDCASERYCDVAQALGLKVHEPSSVRLQAHLVEHLSRWCQGLGVEGGLAGRGLCRSDIPLLAADAMNDACMVTNPRRPTLADIVGLYEAAL